MLGCQVIARVSLAVVLLTGCVGTPERLSWQQTLDKKPEGGTLHLPAGDYRSLVIRRSVTLKGQGPATRLSSLVVDENVTGVRLESLVVQATGEAPAIDVKARASVHLHRVTLECLPRSPTGLRVSGTVEAREFMGRTGCVRAIDVQRGHLVLRSSEVVGEQSAVRLVDATLDASNVQLQVSDDRNGAVIAAARSTIRLEDVSVAGGEQGILVRAGQTSGRGVRVSGTVTGIAFIEGKALLEQVWLRGPFAHAGLLASDASDVEVKGLVVEQAGATGILALRSTVRLSEVSISGARSDADGDFGHAVTLQTASAQIHSLNAGDVQAAGLFAAKSTVRVEGLHVRESGVAVVAVNGAGVTIDGFSKDELTGDVVSTEASTVHFSDVKSPR